MRISIGKLCMSRDMLGHPISVKYKGEDNYKTKVGAFVSIAIQVIVLVYLVQKTIELVTMSDPTIKNLSRALLYEEV